MSEPKKGLGGLFAKTQSESAPEVEIPTQKDVKKRWMMVGAAAVGLLVIGSSWLQDSPKPAVTSNVTDPNKMLSLDPSKDTAKNLPTEALKDIETLRRKNEQMQRELDKLKTTEGSGPAPSSAPVLPTPNYPAVAAAALPPGMAAPPGSVSAQTTKSAPPAPPTPKTEELKPITPADLPVVPVPSSIPSVSEEPSIFPGKPRADKPSDDLAKKTGLSSTGQNGPKATKNKYSGFIPSGSFVPVALLTGVDASASPVAQSNPQPILVQIQADATLPNSAKYKLNKCFALLSAFGDLSSERVYGRVTRISCTDKANKLVLDQAAQGHLVDSDGSLGLRGKLEDRQGAKLGKALLAGFASGLAGAFSNGLTGTTSLVTGLQTGITADQALTKGAYSGAQTAANQLAQFYLQQAQQIFPVIVVPNGRTGSIFLSQGVQLQYKNAADAFTTELKPE